MESPQARHGSHGFDPYLEIPIHFSIEARLWLLLPQMLELAPR